MLAVLLKVHQCYLFRAVWVLRGRVLTSAHFIDARIGAEVV